MWTADIFILCQNDQNLGRRSCRAWEVGERKRTLEREGGFSLSWSEFFLLFYVFDVELIRWWQVSPPLGHLSLFRWPALNATWVLRSLGYHALTTIRVWKVGERKRTLERGVALVWVDVNSFFVGLCVWCFADTMVTSVVPIRWQMLIRCSINMLYYSV